MSRYRKFSLTRMAIFTTVLCAGLFTFAANYAKTANAIDGIVTYKRGDFVKYSNYETAWMTFDGIHGTCATPWKIAPPSGEYQYTSDFETLPNADGIKHPKWILANYLYYGYGGPGFNKSDPAWPKLNRFGQPMTEEDYMVATHILVSDAYTCNGQKSLYGISGKAYRWFAWDILGYGEAVGVNHNNPNATGTIFRSRPNTLNKITPIAIMPGGKWQTCISYKEQSVNVKLKKTDSATKNIAQPHLSLDGAIFEAIDCNGSPHTSISTKDGNDSFITFEKLPVGPIEIREITPPTGYLTSQQVIKIEDPSAQGSLSDLTYTIDNLEAFKETPISFDIEIAKFIGDEESESGIKKPAQDVKFQIISNSSKKPIATLTTDKDGFVTTAHTTNWYGEGKRGEDILGSIPYDPNGYTIHEDPSTTPVGFSACDDWTIDPEDEINGSCLHYIVDNGPVRSRIQVVKRDSESLNTIQKAGFTFELLDSNKQPISQEVWYPNRSDLTTFTTDDSGCVTFPESLQPGTYYIHELKAPAPYVVDDEMHAIEISSDSTQSPLVVVDIYNTSAKGTLHINKKDAETNEELIGASFNLYAAEDIIGADGRILAAENELLGCISMSDEDSSSSIDGLPLNADGIGHYTLYETCAPSGYILNYDPINVEINATDDCSLNIELSLDVTNNPNHFTIEKTSSIDPKLQLPGATFVIWNVGDEVVPDTSINESNDRTQEKAFSSNHAPAVGNPDKVLTAVTDKTGRIVLSKLAPGTYKWAETVAPDGYVLGKPKIHSFSVSSDGIIINENEDTSSTESIETNVPTTTIVEKRDSETDEFLPGATLSLWKTNEDHEPIADAISIWKTENAGKTFYALPFGTYIIQEEDTPLGYDSIEPIEFEVTQTTIPQTIVVPNTPQTPQSNEQNQNNPDAPSHVGILPQTGLPMWPQLLSNTALCATLICICIIICTIARKK